MIYEQLIHERYSVRKFSTQPVESEKIQAVLEAGRCAPTACNNQPQRFYVITGAEGMKKLEKCTSYTFGAPMAILICYDQNECWVRSFDNAPSGETDASIATTQMMLMLTELGLGSTWVGYFDPAAIRKELNLPAHIIPHALLPLGYPSAEAKPSKGHTSTKPMDEFVTTI